MNARPDLKDRLFKSAAASTLSVLLTLLIAAAPTSAPVGLFGGTPTVSLSARLRAASALATLARQTAMTPDIDPSMSNRFLALARVVDPGNTRVAAVARLIDRQRASRTNHQPSARVTSEALEQLRGVAEAACEMNTPPDQCLAAYLFAAASLADPESSDDQRHVEELTKSGAVVDWSAVDVAGRAPAPRQAAAMPGMRFPNPGTDERVRTSTTQPAVKEIHGLVVTRAVDGRMHGRATEIIAVPAMGSSRVVRLIGTVGREMDQSLSEAVRLARLRGADLSESGVEISFDDKYSFKDGGSAGAAFTLLLLSYAGEFDINPAAAITGDITIDSKIRPVGEVAAKVHGAALDHCTLVAIPAANIDQMEDAEILRGPSALWETQVFTCDTLDDAIALMRKDPSPKLVQAMTLFDQLRSRYGHASQSQLKAAGPRADLARILSLAPNHLSAGKLRQWADGQLPTRLTLEATITEAVAAAAPLQSEMTQMAQFRTFSPPPLDRTAVTQGRQSLQRLARIGDPTARPVREAVDRFITAYVDLVETERESKGLTDDWRPALDRAKDADADIRTEVQRDINDPDVLDRLLHGS